MNDVLIVGAGMIGATLGVALRRSGFEVALLDARDQPSYHFAGEVQQQGQSLVSPATHRVSALTPGSISTLTDLGVWPRVNAQACAPFTSMEVWDDEGTASLELPATGVIAENSRIEQALHDSTKVSWNSRVKNIEKSADGYQVELEDGTTLQTSLLIGADGATSAVAKAAGIKTVGWQYDQKAVVANVMTELPHEGVARQVFTEEGPLAFLPLPDSHLCSIVWSSTEADALLGLDESQLCDRLSGAMDLRLGRVIAVSPRMSFPLRQQQAMGYVREQIALVGDAAHTIHPLAGQGANLGFQDAACLARVLGNARLEGKLPGERSVLMEYQRVRQPHTLAVASVMEGLKRLFGTQDPAISWLRNTGMKWVGGNDWLKSQIVSLASK